MVGTHPAATGWVPRGSGPEDLEQTDQDPGDGCERTNALAPRRGPALSWAPGSRVARRTLAHSPLTSFRWIDTPSNKREVSGVIRLKEGPPIIHRTGPVVPVAHVVVVLGGAWSARTSASAGARPCSRPRTGVRR